MRKHLRADRERPAVQPNLNPTAASGVTKLVLFVCLFITRNKTLPQWDYLENARDNSILTIQ